MQMMDHHHSELVVITWSLLQESYSSEVYARLYQTSKYLKSLLIRFFFFFFYVFSFFFLHLSLTHSSLMDSISPTIESINFEYDPTILHPIYSLLFFSIYLSYT